MDDWIGEKKEIFDFDINLNFVKEEFGKDQREIFLWFKNSLLRLEAALQNLNSRFQCDGWKLFFHGLN